MAEMGKECCFPSNFDMPRPFPPRKTELPPKTALLPIKSPSGLVYSRVEVEQLTLGTRFSGTNHIAKNNAIAKIWQRTILSNFN